MLKYYFLQQYVYKIVTNPIFEYIVLIVILINSMQQALESSQD